MPGLGNPELFTSELVDRLLVSWVWPAWISLLGIVWLGVARQRRDDLSLLRDCDTKPRPPVVSFPMDSEFQSEIAVIDVCPFATGRATSLPPQLARNITTPEPLLVLFMNR